MSTNKRYSSQGQLPSEKDNTFLIGPGGHEIELKELSNELEINTKLNVIPDPQPVVTQTPCSLSRVRRMSKMSEWYYGFLHENEGEINLLSDCKDIEDPLNYNEAMSNIDS